MAEGMARGKSSRLMDKKVTILTAVSDYDEIGYPITTWEPMPGGENIWAYYRHASANEFYGAAATNTKLEVIFEIRWRDDVTVWHKIRYNGGDYDITRVDDYEGYKERLRIYAYKIN